MKVHQTPKEVLEAAKQLLIEDGWTPFATPNNHEYDWNNKSPKQKRNPGKPWFINQAISYIAGSETSPLKYQSSMILAHALGKKLIPWELEDGRTKEEIINLFDQAIDTLC